MSKGSTQRPRQVSDDDYANRWDAIFNTHKDNSPDDNPVVNPVEEEKEETNDNS